MRDRHILYLAAFLRAAGVGMIGVFLGIYLAKRGFAASQIGLVVGAGLGGAALAALITTLWGDVLGRRRTLGWVGLLGTAGAIGVGVAQPLVAVVAAAFVGMVNGMGRDRGASLIIDQAILPATATDTERTTVYVYYNVLQDIGHAVGGLLAGAPALVRGLGSVDEMLSLQVGLGIYAALVLSTALVYLRLSPAAEVPVAFLRAKVAPETRRVLTKLSALFFCDSLGGGFLNTALIAYFFYQRFGISEGFAAVLFFLARVANAGSHFGAAWLAKRIGLVNTMVFTHIPSSLLLAGIAFAPNFTVAAAIFLLHESLAEMDVPTRQSYVMALVGPAERTFAAGVTNLVRVAAWAIGPTLAGLVMGQVFLAAPLLVGAAIKIGYDLALYWSFRHLKPPEERAS